MDKLENVVEEPLRVHQLTVKNYKKLRAVTITPDPDRRILILTGKNRQGKTSLIETIWICLLGESYIPPVPIHDGAEMAEASIDFGEFIVTRTITAKTSKLTVRAKDGFLAPSPQTFLSSKLTGMIQNPLEFMRLKGDKQVEILQGLVDLRLDLEEWNKVSGLPLKALPENPIQVFEDAQAYLYKERGKINQEVDRLDGVVKSFIPPEGFESVQPVSVTELFAARRELEDKAQHNMKERGNLEARQDRMKLQETNLVSLRTNIQAAEERLKLMRQEEDEAAEQYATYTEATQALAEIVSALVDPSFAEIDARIASADETNKLAAKIADWAKAKEEWKVAKAKSINYTERMSALKAYKGRLIAEAGMPVMGLGFEGGLVTYNGFPLSQASGAEQIEVSCAVCMASHPRIGLLTLDTGWAELDHDSQSVLRKWAERVGAHIFVVLVSEEPQEEGWHFFDGEVTHIDGKPAPPPEELEPAPKKKRSRKGKDTNQSVEFETMEDLPADPAGPLPSWMDEPKNELPPRLVNKEDK